MNSRCLAVIVASLFLTIGPDARAQPAPEPDDIQQLLAHVEQIVQSGDVFGYLGPTGAGLGANGVLYVADNIDNRIAGIRNRKLGFVFQGFNLFPTLSAGENVELMLDLKAASKARARKRAQVSPPETSAIIEWPLTLATTALSPGGSAREIGGIAM